MAFLIDSNTLLRSNEPGHVQSLPAVNAILALRRRGETLCVARQNLIEFRNVATRPAEKNGLGWPASQADDELAELEQEFACLPDSDNAYNTWRVLVAELGVMGKQVHDARLVAVMLTYDVTHLLTFNVQDFVRFQTLPPGLGGGITVVHPDSV